MSIPCDHPRPKLNLPGYTASKFRWQPPAVIPTDAAGMARSMLESLRGIGAVLQQVGQRRVVVPLLEDIDARAGQVIVGVADGQIIRLPDIAPGEDGVSIVVTDVVTPLVVVNPDGTATNIRAPGSYEFTPSDDGTTYVPGAGSTGGSLGLLLPGAPIYDVMAEPFNAAGNGSTDDTAAINLAIAAANAAPGLIYLGRSHRITAALDAITNNNIVVKGRGPFNGGTLLIDDSAAGVNVLTFQGPQYVGAEDIWIVGNNARTAGWGIRIVNCFRAKLNRILISQKAFGVEFVDSLLTDGKHVFLDDLYGVFGFLARGTGGGSFNHAVRLENCVGGTNYPATVVGKATIWAASTAYIVGNIVFANSAIYQCVQAGTSSGAGTGPSGIPSTSTSTAHSTQITDGTVRWVFAMPLTTWFLQGSYAHTFEVIDCGTLQGGYGLSVEDTTPGVSSIPEFTRVQNFQADHPFSGGINLSAVISARFDQTFVTSVLEGSGITIGASCENWEFVGGEVFGCNKAGFLVGNGDGAICAMQIGAIGTISSNTRDCIEVAAGCDNFTIIGCSGGTMAGSTSPTSRYGLSIGAGCDNFVVTGNRFVSNITGSILNTPGRASTRVVLNNVPDVTISPGSVWGLQVDGATGVPIEITGLEVGELLRRETIINTTSTGTVTTFAITNIATQVVCKSTSALTIRGMTATSATFGKTIEFSMHAGFAGTVIFNNEDASAASALERIACPENTTLTITAGQVAILSYFDSRWRVVAVSRAAVVGVTDGDKGDVTVSSTGTVWTVDNDVVTFAKMQNIGYGVLGNPTFATTTDPSLIAPPGANTVLQDNGSGTLAFRSLATTSIVHGALGVYERAALTGDVTATQNSNATTIAADVVTDTKLRNSGALSVIGRSANTSGDPADISGTASSDAVLRISGTTLGFGTVATAGIADAAVTLAKLANLAAGTVIGRQVSAATGVPVALSGVEQGQNLRRETIATDTTSSGAIATYAIANTTTQVQFKLAGAATINGMTATSATFGKLVAFSFDSGFAGSVTWTNESGSAGAALERCRTPSAASLTISAGETAVFEYFDSRWRCLSVGKSVTGLTDGDKGDITVSGSGGTWTVDAATITDAKISNRTALSVFGRSANSSGVGADVSATAASGAVLRESGSVLGFGTVATAGIANDAVTTAKILDANVTLAKMANLAQSTIVGRAEGAGTGVPTALTPSQVTSIIDAETLFWTGPHDFSAAVNIRGSIRFATVATAVLAAQQDNFTAGSVTQCRFTLTGSQSLSGIVPDTVSEECVMLVTNADDTDNLTLLHNSASSTNTNRFFLPGNTDRVLLPRASALIHYDVTDGRWHMVYGV